MSFLLCFFFVRYGDHRYIHVLTYSFPTRRSSDLDQRQRGVDCGRARRHYFELQAQAFAKITRGHADWVEVLDFEHDRFQIVDRQLEFLQQACRQFRPVRQISVVVDRIDQIFGDRRLARSEEHTVELQSLLSHSYAVSCWKTKNSY